MMFDIDRLYNEMKALMVYQSEELSPAQRYKLAKKQLVASFANAIEENKKDLIVEVKARAKR